MDEPTNDLDVDTLEVVEDLLVEFSGTLFLVSHDRALLNHVVSRTVVLEGAGRVSEYVGGYDDWLLQRGPDVSTTEAPAVEKMKRPRPQKPRPVKLGFKEQRELEGLPDHIQTLEDEQNRLYDSLANPDIYRQKGSDVALLKLRLEALELELARAFERWEELEGLREQSIQ
jgi:ATP-binding cassette subfamily F protein uup